MNEQTDLHQANRNLAETNPHHNIKEPNENPDQVQDKRVNPKEALKLIETNQAVLVELETVDKLDNSLIRLLKSYKIPEKKLLVNIFSIRDRGNFLEREKVDHFLSHLSCIDGVVTTPKEEDDFSFKTVDQRFSGNTHFIGDSIHYQTQKRLSQIRSPYNGKAENKLANHPKYVDIKNIAEIIASLQSEGKKVVLVAGVLDVLHPGHIEFLEKAKKNGDALVILINSDYSVSNQPKNVKKDRPIHPLQDRVSVLTELDFTDHISAFDSPNILEILEQLHNIVYIKTEKDLKSETVKKEIVKVLDHGGEIITFATTKDDKQEHLSSTRAIEAARSVLYSENSWEQDFMKQPEQVMCRVYDILTALGRWNSQTFILTFMQEVYSTIHELTQEEQTMIENYFIENIIMKNLKNIQAEIGYARDYHSYLIPFLIGKLVGFDIQMLPVQYKKEGFPLEIINVVKGADGKMLFFNAASDTIYPRFLFEDEYWKPLPNQNNFIAKNATSSFKRIFVHTEKQQHAGIGMKILMEEAGTTTDPDNQLTYNKAIVKSVRNAWSLFWNSPIEPDAPLTLINDLPLKTTHNTERKYPGIVAHGGIAALETAGGFPENSRTGIQASIDAGVEIVELDVVPTSDKQWIASHDIRLNIATEGSGLTTEHTLDELKKVRLKKQNGETIEETMLSLDEALEMIGKAIVTENHDIIVKIDIKYLNPEAEHGLVDSIRRCPLPKNKIIITSGIGKYSKRIQERDPDLSFELNTVEVVNFLLSYGLMDDDLMPDLLVEAFSHYAPKFHANTVSLLLFAMEKWGNKSFRKIVDGIHRIGLVTQVWTAESIEQYLRCAEVGADYVLIHNPELVNEVNKIIKQ